MWDSLFAILQFQHSKAYMYIVNFIHQQETQLQQR